MSYKRWIYGLSFITIINCGNAFAASTINTNIPPAGQPYHSSGIRNNFGAAANDITALQNAMGSSNRIALTTTGNLYVSPSGVDGSNNCTNPAAPCATLQYAANIAVTKYDLAGQTMFINMAAGTYTTGVGIINPLTGAGGSVTLPSTTNPNDISQIAHLIFNGNVSNPDLVIVNVTGSVNPVGFYAEKGAAFAVQGVKITVPNGFAVFAQNGAKINVSNVDFGAATDHMVAFDNAMVEVDGNYSITGGATCHIDTGYHGVIRTANVSTPIIATLTGTPAFTGAFACLNDNSSAAVFPANITFTGSATGLRFLISNNSVLDTSTGTATYLPGNSAGKLISNGIYNPPLAPTIGSVFGLATGGTAQLSATRLSNSQVGAISFTTGSSGPISGSGFITLNWATAELKTCVTTGGAGFNPGGGIMAVTNDVINNASTFYFSVSQNTLQYNTNYALNYICSASN